MHRVDNLPRHIGPFVKAYGILGAAGMKSMMELSRLTSQFYFVRFQEEVDSDDESRRRRMTHSNNNINNNEETNNQLQQQQQLPYQGPCIHATWHENIPAYLTYYHLLYRNSGKQQQQQQQQQQCHLWLQHPALYMKPVHTTLEFLGIDYVLGSSGHGGQDALNKIIEKLSNQSGDNNNDTHTTNWCTAMFPDGPSGPIHECKLGVIQLAASTNLPIIPIRFQFTSSWRVGWDQKHLPKFGSKITIIEYPPINPNNSNSKDDNTEASMAEAAQRLQDILNHGFGKENNNDDDNDNKDGF